MGIYIYLPPLFLADKTLSGAEMAPESLSGSSLGMPWGRSDPGLASRSISMLSSGCLSSASLWNVLGRELDLDPVWWDDEGWAPILAPPPRPPLMPRTEKTGDWRASVSDA